LISVVSDILLKLNGETKESLASIGFCFRNIQVVSIEITRLNRNIDREWGKLASEEQLIWNVSQK